MKKDDLKDRTDIVRLIDLFYEKIRIDEIMGPIFNDIANVNWDHHLPKMYDFWNMALFDVAGYEGHPLKPHLALNSIHQINAKQFETWLVLFFSSVDELFEGEKANEIKMRANSIGETWSYKFDYLNKLDK